MVKVVGQRSRLRGQNTLFLLKGKAFAGSGLATIQISFFFVVYILHYFLCIFFSKGNKTSGCFYKKNSVN